MREQDTLEERLVAERGPQNAEEIPTERQSPHSVHNCSNQIQCFKAREQIFLIAIFCGQHSFNVPTNIYKYHKNHFYHFLYGPLSP